VGSCGGARVRDRDRNDKARGGIMFRFDSKRMLYFRVPGTGSTSFLDMVKDQRSKCGDDHAMACDTRLDFREEYKDWEWFTIIRNPYDWAITFHAMCCRSLDHYNDWCDGEHSKEKPLEDFLSDLKITPLDWITVDEKLAGTVYKIESEKELSRKFDLVKLDKRRNSHPDLHKGEWTAYAIDAAKIRLHRELAYYPEIKEPEAK